MQRGLLALALVALMVSAASASRAGRRLHQTPTTSSGSVNQVDLSQYGQADVVNQNVRLFTKADKATGTISQDGQATQSLDQRIHVIAPARTDTTGLSYSQTGTSGGTLKRQVICSGGGDGCRGTENTQASALGQSPSGG